MDFDAHRVTLARRPTPLEPLAVPGLELWVKRDDLSGEPYGGNKVRKLEFLLADALEHGATETLTFGAVGSNHALATAVYATKLGLHPISVLGPQPITRGLRRNLLAQAAVSTEIHVVEEYDRQLHKAAEVLLKHERETGKRPYVIPFGGTNALGTLGFVNAAFELAEQVQAGEAPVPDLLYVPLGSMGTAAGLILGLAMLDWPTVVVAVRVTPLDFAGEQQLEALLGETAALLRERGAAVPEALWEAYDLRHDFFGEQYALFTPEGMAAVRQAGGLGMRLEGTYTGKTFAALLADERTGRLEGKNVLFWNTYNSRPMEPLMAETDYHQLPEGCWRYFTEDCQELDR